MYYMVEGFEHASRQLDKPTRTQAVTIQQLAGTIIRMLESGISLVAVTAIDETTFQYFYQERRKGNGK